MQLRNCCLLVALVLARMRGKLSVPWRIGYEEALYHVLCFFLPALLDFLQFSLDDGQLYGQGNSFSPCCFWLLQKKAKEDRPVNEYSVSVFQKGEKITQKYN